MEKGRSMERIDFLRLRAGAGVGVAARDANVGANCLNAGGVILWDFCF